MNMGSTWNLENPFRSPSGSRREDDEEALRWATLQKLPTYNRLIKNQHSAIYGGTWGQQRRQQWSG